MQIRLTIVDPDAAGRSRDVVLDAPAGTTVGDVVPLLAADAGQDAGTTGLYVDGRPLDHGLLVGVPPLVDGALLLLGRPGARPGRACGQVGGLLELHVVGGPDCGTVHPLGPGTHRLGRAGVTGPRLDDPDVSRHHARVDVAAGGVTVRDLGSTNGTTVDGEPLGSDPVPLPEGALLRLGSSTVVLRRPTAAAAALVATGRGTVEVNRAPRLRDPDPDVVVRLPAEPRAPEPRRLPVLALVLPLVVAVPLALLWSPYALLFAVTSPVVLVGSLVEDRRSGRRAHRRALAGHTQALARARADLTVALADELAARRDAAPDAARLLAAARAPTGLVWHRRPDDPDVLDVRVGTATLPAAVRVVEGGDDTARRPDLPDAPVVVRLDDVAVLGVAGPRERVLALARHVVGQVAVLHSPRDVACVVLTSRPGAAHDWAWSTWLPHLRPAAGAGVEADDGCDALVGADPEQVRRRVGALDALVTARSDATTGAAGRPGPRAGAGGWSGPRVVVVLDGAGRLRSVPGVARLLQDGPAVGLRFVCTDDDVPSLPGECRGTVLLGGEAGTRAQVRIDGAEPVDGVVPDLVGTGWAVGVGRALAPLRDATPERTGHALPASVRLLDVLGDGAAEPAAVIAGWQRRPRSTKATLGVSAAGPFVVDLRHDGPHVLVAGTTGAGKSELLRTLVASLALVNRPDELVFVLVDYKGGAAFADCARLPHTAGVVTDLDRHLTGRALVSLQAEVRRRERLLRDHGAADLEAYLALVDRQRAPRLPRLLVVVDEFRVLAEELPEFVSGLVRLAAVGRSLGLHLVLATQRPGGAVSPDMRANVNLRIALRVRDALDSTDVVDSGQATAISARTPGRAVVRAGSNHPTPVQTASVSAGPAGHHAQGATARRTSPATLGEPPPRPAGTAHPGPPDLEVIVRGLREAADALGVAAVARPWLPPLPGLVLAADVAAAEAAAAEASAQDAAPAFGLVDLPDEQRQEALRWDVGTGGCLAVVGTGRSGRTTALASVVVAAASRWSPEELGVYVLDGGGALGPVAGLPHVGAVVPRDDTDRTARALRMLVREVTARSAGRGWTRRLLLVVDGWESLRAVHDDLDGPGLEPVLQVIREGPAVGVHTVLAGDRSVLMGATGSAVAERLVLRTADPTDAVLAGVPARDLPAHLPPGRGLRVGAGGVREVQVAVLRPSDVPPWPGAVGPPPVPPMPEAVRVASLSRAAPARDGALLLGVGGDDVRPLALVPADDGPVVLVAGHPRSGRSTTLALLATGLAAQGTPVVVVTPRRSALDALPGDRLLARLGLRDGRALADCLEASRGAVRPAAVLVDDVELVERTDVEPVLLDLLARAESTGELCLLAGSSPDLAARFTGVGAEARKHGVGVLLGPVTPLDGDVLGVRVPRRPERRPGRGLLVRRGEMVPVQVALPEAPEAPEAR